MLTLAEHCLAGGRGLEAGQRSDGGRQDLEQAGVADGEFLPGLHCPAGGESGLGREGEGGADTAGSKIALVLPEHWVRMIWSGLVDSHCLKVLPR